MKKLIKTEQIRKQIDHYDKIYVKKQKPLLEKKVQVLRGVL